MSFAKIGELDHRPLRPFLYTAVLVALNKKTLTASLAIMRCMSPNNLVRSLAPVVDEYLAA